MGNVKRALNKAKKQVIISKINEKIGNRYNKIRTELLSKTKEEIDNLLSDTKMSKTDRIAHIHALKKIDEDDRTNNNQNALLGEDNSIPEEKS